MAQLSNIEKGWKRKGKFATLYFYSLGQNT